MREPFGLFPWSFNNLNSCNSTKNSLLNTQAYLKNLHIETSKRGQVGKKEKGKKGEEMLGTMDAALKPEAYGWSQPSGKESGVAGAPFWQRSQGI